MNEWEIAALLLGLALVPCLAVCAFARRHSDALVAVELAGVLVCTILVLLAEGFHRQPFIDLALVLAPTSLIGALTFVRLMERDL